MKNSGDDGMRGKRQVKGIAKELLETVFEASKSSHPHEFAALLRATDGVISEILLVPGTTSNDTSARMLLDMMPLDMSIVGSVHSHPVHDLRYSDEDLHMFGAKGVYNIIVAFPYGENDWICYNPRGEQVDLSVITEGT
jgi:proteasome lid subunit RPN8/RPN11